MLCDCVVQDCHCRLVTGNTAVRSAGSVLQLTFAATGMAAAQDWRDFSLAGSFQFVSAAHCRDRTAGRGGGRVTLLYNSPQQPICDKEPRTTSINNMNPCKVSYHY